MKKRNSIFAAAAILGSLLIVNPLSAQAADGWQLEEGSWYYYQDDQPVENSWISYHDKWYYLGTDGAMATGWLEWQEQWYYLNLPNGDMAADCFTPDGWLVDQNGAWIRDRYDGLVQNEYPDLSVNVSVSGSSVAGETAVLAITLKNNGKQTLVYTRGSGSFVTPQALLVRAPRLQPVIPGDHLGAATMDYRRDTLGPGQEISYTLHVRLTQPNDQFDRYSYQMRDGYIGDISWQSLKAAHPDVNQAEAGSYRGQVYFLYSLAGTDGDRMVFGEDTGYSCAGFNIEVQ